MDGVHLCSEFSLLRVPRLTRISDSSIVSSEVAQFVYPYVSDISEASVQG